jgi:hypothetical protein
MHHRHSALGPGSTRIDVRAASYGLSDLSNRVLAPGSAPALLEPESGEKFLPAACRIRSEAFVAWSRCGWMRPLQRKRVADGDTNEGRRLGPAKRAVTRPA